MARWSKIGSRGNVEDRRGMAPAVGGIGIGGILLYMLFNYLSSGEVSVPVEALQNISVTQNNLDTAQFEGADSYEVFASTVLGSNNDMWRDIFSKANRDYEPPKLVLFRQATESACGGASTQVGPHYCNLDQTIYLDETFFDELTQRFGAQGGDVAEAYVIAHEVAHHAQNLLGILDKVHAQASNDEAGANDLSVQLELQADCFAGLWANSIKNLEVLEPNEISEAMDAAAAVGDDRIQESVTGRINPESWTHGSSEQRAAWFTRGYEAGNLASCDTFK
jgi:uncharacterized protein